MRSSPSPMASFARTTSCRTRSSFRLSSRSSFASSKLNRVYLGVGPEQNFTYIAALRPKMVFIVDVRRGNLHLHLMYKALFEMSTRPRGLHLPPVLPQASRRVWARSRRAGEIFAALYKATPEKEARRSPQAESQAAAGPPDADASPAAHDRRSQGYRVRLHAVLLVRSRTLGTGRPAVARAGRTRQPTGT